MKDGLSATVRRLLYVAQHARGVAREGTNVLTDGSTFRVRIPALRAADRRGLVFLARGEDGVLAGRLTGAGWRLAGAGLGEGPERDTPVGLALRALALAQQALELSGYPWGEAGDVTSTLDDMIAALERCRKREGRGD